MNKASRRNIALHVSIRCFNLNLPEEKTISVARVCEKDCYILFTLEEDSATIRISQSEASSLWDENVGRIYSPWNLSLKRYIGGIGEQ